MRIGGGSVALPDSSGGARRAPWAPFTPALNLTSGSGQAVTLTESSFLGFPLEVEVTAAGILGVGLFRYRTDGGTWVTGLTLGALVPLSGLGVNLIFGAGLYGLGATYAGSI